MFIYVAFLGFVVVEMDFWDSDGIPWFGRFLMLNSYCML